MVGRGRSDALREALLAYDEEVARIEASRVVEAGADSDAVLAALDSLSATIREIGDRFQAGEIFLPELMMAAEAMTAATVVLTAALPAGAAVSRGTVVIGTAKGDVHDIGKTIVSTMLTAAGFEVVDIGIDVPPSRFAEAAEKNRASIVAVSAIMATTLSGQKDVIDYFEAVGIRSKHKIIVGGAACSKAYAEMIGADGWAEDAAAAAELATGLVA